MRVCVCDKTHFTHTLTAVNGVNLLSMRGHTHARTHTHVDVFLNDVFDSVIADRGASLQQRTKVFRAERQRTSPSASPLCVL